MASTRRFIWCNGVWVGYSQDGRRHRRRSISALSASGRQPPVHVMVMRWSAGGWLEDQDMWRMSGIFRSVWLLNKPQQRLCDDAVDTSP
ncbi:hypothetical protein MJ579_14115 [Klebsiella pneumoniae]|nr:hypothetical protein MJ579_14115 [Klebsiella pneumoniae]